jgi:hypothetical protein
MNGKPEIDRVKKCADDLMEHFDSVMIFATEHDGSAEGTRTICFGRGNMYARIGQVREWLIRQDEISKQMERDSDV